ncbi:MAG: hypothetical protein ABJA11_09720 [Pseudolysinimonas sp.]
MAAIDPPLPASAPTLEVAGGYISGTPPRSQLHLLVTSAEAQAQGTTGETKTVKLPVGQSTTFLGFTVTVTGICGTETYYDATADASLRETGTPSPTP